jgi:hypothetical protein
MAMIDCTAGTTNHEEEISLGRYPERTRAVSPITTDEIPIGSKIRKEFFARPAHR